MEVMEAIRKRRSIRQYRPDKIGREILEEIANAGRIAASPMNLQPLHFLIIDEKKTSDRLFRTLKWAGHLEGWTPKEDVQPPAYIAVLVDLEIKERGYEYDIGLSASNILLAATGFGLGSCPLAVVDREETKKILSLGKRYLPVVILAMGYAAEESMVEDMNGDVKYFRDNEGKIHVPKRKKEEVIHYNSMK